MSSPSGARQDAFDPFAEPPATTAAARETSLYGSTTSPTHGGNTTAVGVAPSGATETKSFYDGADKSAEAPTTDRAAAPPEPAGEDAPRAVPTSKVWKIEFYQQFFDVNTKTVAMRLFSALFPLKAPDFLAERNWHYNGESAAPEPVEGVPSHSADLYGPFWLCTTLWMLVGIVSNVLNRYSFAKYKDDDDTTTWTYDFSVTSIACWVIYLYCFAFGSVVWGIMKWKNLPATLVDTVCLYGYSMFIFIIITAICIIPVNVLHWVIVMVGGAYSALYLLVNFWRMWKAALEPQWFIGIVALVAGAHMGLALLFKLYFFHYKL